MKLHDLLAPLGLGESPPENPEIRGVSHDSRRIRSGDLYVAIRGARFDGRDFAPQAVSRGAVAVLGRGRPSRLDAPWVEAEDPRALLGPIAARLYGEPHEKLRLVGITGTNGKSTVIALVARILEAAGQPTGVVGTLGYRFGDRAFDELGVASGVRTTPEASDLFRTLQAMHQQGAEAVAMEVSSHALELGRVSGARFDVAVFTNLSHDHLDFHGDLEGYFAAKSRLFDQLKPGGRAVVNCDDPWGRRLAEQLGNAVTFDDAGDVRVLAADCDLCGIRARIATPRGELALTSSLIGRYNLSNLLAAVGVAEALELPHEAVRRGVAALKPLAGRLEPIDVGQSFPVLVDYAHTPAALEASLESLRELGDHRLVVVFGCGGDRDRGKREPMGEVAGRLADVAIATSDNPRGEDPMAILAAVERGLVASGRRDFVIEPDRRLAIQRAVALACDDPRSLVMVAGKGHEQEQVIGGRRLPFNDREELEMALRHGLDGRGPDGRPLADRSVKGRRGGGRMGEGGRIDAAWATVEVSDGRP